MNVRTKFLMDKKGRRRVTLSFGDYKRIMRYLEDLEDSLDLRKAKKEAKGFIELNEFIDSLKSS